MANPKKRILTEFDIFEVSVVDNPAQEQALMRLIKGNGTARFYKTGAEVAAKPVKATIATAHAADKQEVPMPSHTAFENTQFGTLADAIDFLKFRGLSPLKAMMTASRTFPQLVAKHNATGVVAAAKALEPPLVKSTSSAAEKWDNLVAGIALRDKVSRSVAMQRARRAHPDAFAAMQAA